MDNITKLCTFNTNGLRIEVKRKAIFDWLKQKHYDICFLQETHSCFDTYKRWELEWQGKIVFSHGETNSKGVAILFSKNIDITINDTVIDPHGRYVMVNCEINKKKLSLINIYSPTKDNEKDQMFFLDTIIDCINNCENEIILGGDLNTYLNTLLDKKGTRSEIQSKYSVKWNSVIENFKLVDIWRLRHPNELRFTWRARGRNGLVQSRLDYILISESLEYTIENTNISSSIKSDHSIVSIDINFMNIECRGRGLWKFNCKYLKDPEFIEMMKNTIQVGKEESKTIVNSMIRWDFIKCMIRSKSIEYSIRKRKQERETEEALLTRLNILEEECDKNPNCEKYEEYINIKHELDYIYDMRAKGTIIRSRCQWTEENERNTKYFLNLEKHNYNMQHIKALLINDKVVVSPDEILKYEGDYYEKLYSKAETYTVTAMNDYLKNIVTPKLTEGTKQICESEISMEECSKALKALPNNKSPGSDGIPVEFYKIFWLDLQKPLLKSFQLGKINKELSYSQREGIIKLIPKQGKDIRLLKNWRPISLLNADYKILTKILANRMKLGLKEIINEDQIGYTEKRFCGENTRLIADIMEYSKTHKIESILLLIDFEKAFDTISWNFLYKTLESYNYGHNFIDWIRILYNNIFSKITNNGYLSDNFSIHRGIRQGDPISALLFLPVAEIMATVIRNNSEIKGLNIGDIELKLCQLADDTSLFLKDVSSIKIALDSFEEFYRYAGLRLNRTKTEAIIMYNEGNIIKDESLNINWNETSFKTLGIWYSTDTEEMLYLNIGERLEKIKVLLRIWSARYLSLKGKIVVLKSLVMPHIIHIASVLFIENTVIKELDKMLFDFLWSGRKHGISKSTIIRSIDMGGLKMICIETMIKAIKIMWLKRLTNDVKAKWKVLSWLLMGINKEMLFSRLDQKFIKVPAIKFYVQVLNIWYDFMNIVPESNLDILNENLFYNNLIIVNNKTLGKEFHTYKMLGMCKVIDIYNKAEKRFYSYNEMNVKYNVYIDVLSYNKLIMSIPRSWKSALKVSDNKTLSKLHSILYKDKDLFKLYNKDVYNIFISRNSSPVISQEKWIESYPFLEGINWDHLYRLPYVICSTTYIQSLQYKILHRYVNCNANLFKWKIVDSPNCVDCNIYDSIEHFFYNCPKVAYFWKNVQVWLFNVLETNIKFTVLEVLLGILQENQYSKICNYVILHGKKYIYEAKGKQKEISTIEFIKKVKYSLDTEHHLSITNDTLNNFENIFGEFFHSI